MAVDRPAPTLKRLPKAPSTPSPVAAPPPPAVSPKPVSPPVAKPSKAPLPVEPEPGVTTIAALVDVGWGNELFIRGRGQGLSWEKGQRLRCLDASTWVWTSTRATEKVTFKLLLNDQVWSRGHDLTAVPGQRLEVTPAFS